MAPSPGPSSGPREIPTEKPASSLADAVRARREEVQGELAQAANSKPSDVQTDLASGDPDRLSKAIDRLRRGAERLGRGIDQVVACLTPFGVRRSDVEYADRTPPPMEQKGPVESAVPYAFEIGKQFMRLGERMKTLQPYIFATASKYGLKPSLLGTIMAKESSCNPLAFNTSSNASGLSQVVPDTFANYMRQRPGVVNPELENKLNTGGVQALSKILPLPPKFLEKIQKNPGNKRLQAMAIAFDPKTAVDIAGWVIKGIINASQQYPPKYRLTMDSPVDQIYLAYNSGVEGRYNWLKYKENPSRDNLAKLKYWQRRALNGRMESESREAYARSVGTASKNFAYLDAEFSKQRIA